MLANQPALADPREDRVVAGGQAVKFESAVILAARPAAVFGSDDCKDVRPGHGFVLRVNDVSRNRGAVGQDEIPFG